MTKNSYLVTAYVWKPRNFRCCVCSQYDRNLYADRLMPNQGGYRKIQHLAHKFHDLIFPNIILPFGTQIGYKQ